MSTNLSAPCAMCDAMPLPEKLKARCSRSATAHRSPIAPTGYAARRMATPTVRPSLGYAAVNTDSECLPGLRAPSAGTTEA